MYLQSNVTKLNKLHYKVLHQIFNVKSSFYHEVLEPAEADCSNEYLSQLAYEYAPNCCLHRRKVPRPYSQTLGFPGTLSTFHTAHVYRRLHRKRPGHPRIHWAELTGGTTC